MKVLEIGFVILHYLLHEQTIKSIDSIIKNIDTQNYHIVVVDNFSNNGSTEKLETYIKKNNKVTLLKNFNNLGFAKGNNTGIKYLNDNYDCQFICVLNNDVYLKSSNLWKCISEEFELSNFAVAGPKIYTKDGKTSSNPVRKEPFSYKSIKHRKLEITIFYFLYRFHFFTIANCLEKLMSNKRKNNVVNKHAQDCTVKQYRIQLHGCFYIFSKTFFKHYNGFDDRTFLYMEEEILFCNLLNKNLVSVYLPEIEVFHEEDASTNEMMLKNKTLDKRLFILKNHKISIKVLLDVMKKK